MSEVANIVGSTVVWSSSATLLVMLPAVPLAYLMARRDFWAKGVLNALTSLPMVLPPTAVGYLLLRLLADNGPLAALGLPFDVLFRWQAVVCACAVMALPLVLRTARVAFEAVDPRLEVMAATLGYPPLKAFFVITLPLAWRGLLAAAILGFTRGIGEFGATIMIAGNIPGRTQTLATAIFSAQQAGDESRAMGLIVVAIVVGFVAVYASEWLSRRQPLPLS